MEFFAKAKVVRLKSQHNKYLVGLDDEDSVKQSRSGSSKNARWSVEPVDNKQNVIRLKNCQSWKYLRATDDPFLLGMTGRRVSQASPTLRLDNSVEWEPIKKGSLVRLRTRKDTFLRANGGIPPWNNSVTHDVPSRSSSQDWILWTVDVLEFDYQSTDAIKVSDVDDHDVGLSRISSMDSTISKADYFKDCYEDNVSKPTKSQRPSNVDQVTQTNQDYSVDSNAEDAVSGSLSRNSSSGSTGSKMENYKDCNENEVVSQPAPKSVRSKKPVPAAQPPSQSSKANPKAQEKPTRVSPSAHHSRDEPKHSDSFHKLKTALDGLDDLLDEDNDHDSESEEADSEPPVVEPTIHKPHYLEVKMAKHTLKELQDFDYETVLSSGKDKKLEEAVNILIADVKASSHSQLPNEIESLRDQLKSMKEDHNSASQDIEEYTTFSIKRFEVKSDLKKDAAKAHELETLEVGLSSRLMNAKAKRDEILKQLEEAENTINAAEKAKADNDREIDELVTRIGEKSESLREMERNEKSWQARKFEAERKLERVEEDWEKMQSLFEDI